MQPNILMFIWAGVGLDCLLSRLSAHPRVLSSIGLVVVAVAVALQAKLHFAALDMSDAWHFRNYARAILEPLPQNAILLINYDMQWTSARYIQVCEGYRPDVSLINLSMMTYKVRNVWFCLETSLGPSATPEILFPSFQSGGRQRRACTRM